ncbi:probable Medium-chain fatty acid ethyl ester synthase/esterase 2 [Zygosaccharomyces bailii]|nr:probable Medium-chain fatty acid ethyl ester synthase/esterase 2 [Zygosaccharomyces bailii]
MSGLPIINPLHWGFNGTVKQTYDPSGTTRLTMRRTKDKIEFRHFVNQYIPTLKDGHSFRLHHFLFTGILQTMYLSTADFSKCFPVFYGREIVEYSDGGASTTDWVMKSWEKKYDLDIYGNYKKLEFERDEEATHPDNWPRLHPRTRYFSEEEKSAVHANEKPLIVIIHGLAGGSHEPMIRSLTAKLSTIAGERFQVVVLNCRGCARSKITNKKLFSAFQTGDLKEFLAREKARHPARKIYAVGFSFGASLLANYLGEVGDKSDLKAAVTLCNPWDFILCSEKMKNDYWSRNLFSKAITQFLTRLVKVNMGELESPEGSVPDHQPSVEDPCLYMCTQSNMERAKKFTQMRQFDDMFTAPSLGFSSAEDYYRAGSSINRLHNVQVPLLIINSKDDPIVGPQAIPYTEAKNNSNVLLLSTDLGGHLAFLNENFDSWINIQIATFLYKFDEFIE